MRREYIVPQDSQRGGTEQFFNSGAYQKQTKNNNNSFFSPAFWTRVAEAIFFFAFFPLKCPRQRRHHEHYSQLSAVLLSAFKRKCRELSIEYLDSPEIGGVCEISSKEREGPPSFRLKAPHIYTRYKEYNNKSARQCNDAVL